MNAGYFVRNRWSITDGQDGVYGQYEYIVDGMVSFRGVQVMYMDYMNIVDQDGLYQQYEYIVDLLVSITVSQGGVYRQY